MKFEELFLRSHFIRPHELGRKSYDVIVFISVSGLFHSFMSFGKIEFIKYSVMQIKEGAFVSFFNTTKTIKG